MSKITTALFLLRHHKGEFFATILQKMNFLFPDKLYLTLLFRLKMGYWIDWKKPKTFSEKLQWLKLYDRKPEYTTMVDKYAVKEYVANIIGREYIIPTLGVWDRPEDIDWDCLPQKFVLKTTHAGGGSGVLICKDKATFDRNDACIKLKRSLSKCVYNSHREWPYKNVPKRIIAEAFLEEAKPVKHNTDLPDYKFYCFNGEPVYCQVIRDRSSKETIDFYDMEWRHMPFVGLNPTFNISLPFFTNGATSVEKPIHLSKMIDACRKLSKEIMFSRIDLYVIDDKIYFGEITFYPASGIGVCTPIEWNDKLGHMIGLPFEN